MATAEGIAAADRVTAERQARHSRDGVPRIWVDRVAKRFGAGSDAIVAMESASFTVGQGEFVTIVGPSGCGKSTLLNVIAGLDEPSEGTIAFDGEALADRRSRCGVMFQKDLLFPWRTNIANVALGLEVAGVGRRDARARAGALLARFGLAQFANHYPSQLSGGMRQRLALMRTLLCDRPILLLDEPFAALDSLTRGLMQEWLLAIWSQERRTILFITHDIDEAIFLSDRVLLMSARPGRIRRELAVPLPRPRDHTMTTAPDFVRLKQTIRDELHEESLKADQSGLQP